MSYVPDPRRDLQRFARFLRASVPFRFSRISDGELFILRNERLILSSKEFILGEVVVRASYEDYDRKSFEPELHQAFRQDFIASCRHVGPAYYVGLPGRNVLDREAERQQILTWRGGIDERCTFADLLINENYRRFVSTILPLFHRFRSVVVLGNHRMRPNQLNTSWQLIPVPDDLIGGYPASTSEAERAVLEVPEGSLVLSSASTYSNVLAARVDVQRPDVTFIDVGTALHPFMGMGEAPRDYHVQLSPLLGRKSMARLRYRFASHRTIRW